MGKEFALPVGAAVCGAVGLGLRRWQLATGFEAETGLAVPGTPAAVLLAGWAALAVVVLAVLCRRGRRERQSWEFAFAGAGKSSGFKTAVVVAGFLLLAAVGGEILTIPPSYQASLAAETWAERMAALVLPPVRMLLCLGGCPCVMLWGRRLAQRDGKCRENLALLELCLLFCVCLISNYQERAADPVVMDYIYEVLAICFDLLGLYYIAGYSFQETGRPGRTVFACLMGVFFSLVAMADLTGPADVLRYGFAILFLGAHAALLLQDHPVGEVPPAETEVHENA